MSENLEEKKPIYKKWWFWIIIVVLVLGISLSSMERNTQQVASNNNVVESRKYEYVSYSLKNNSTEKVEKLVTNENISSEEMKKIYNEEKENNTNFKTYTICFFSDKDTALKANNYELGYVTSKDGEIIVENVQEIKQAEEEKKEKEKLENEEKERLEQERLEEEQNQKIENATIGEKNALDKAKSYLDYTAFSKEGLIEQLEYEGFTNAEAKFGVDNCGANWNEQAAKKAKQYMDYSSFSKQGLIEQLEYEGFTSAQAEYGAKAVGY